MLLLIGNILTLEAEGEEREFGILRALGMSKRQLRWQLNCRAARAAQQQYCAAGSCMRHICLLPQFRVITIGRK